MTSVNFTMRNPNLSGGKYTGTLEVSGEDPLGREYKHEEDFSVDVKHEWDIPVAGGICKIHISVWQQDPGNPKRFCVDGHINCQGAQQNTNGPACFDV